MSSANGSSTSSKVIIGLLIFILVLMVAGGVAYWRQVDADQKQQQAQIDTLNKQLDDTKASASEKSADAQSQREADLTKRNEELQSQLDAINENTDATTAPQSSTPPAQ